jgi:hypothetical protein
LTDFRESLIYRSLEVHVSVANKQKMGRFLQVVVAVACCLFVGILLVVAGLLTFATGSAGCTLASGRSIDVVSNGWFITMGFSADTATIDTGGRNIVVAPNYVQVDGRRIASLDPATKAVEVKVARGGITVVGDGQSVSTLER